jgi:hypothetical protein
MTWSVVEYRYQTILELKECYTKKKLRRQQMRIKMKILQTMDVLQRRGSRGRCDSGLDQEGTKETREKE